MFKEPVEILPNVNYTACATLKVSHLLVIIPDTRAAQHCLGVHFSHRKRVNLIVGIVQNLEGLINAKFQLFSMLGIHLNSNIILEKCWFLCLHTSDSCGQMRYVLGFSIHPSVGYLLVNAISVALI